MSSILFYYVVYCTIYRKIYYVYKTPNLSIFLYHLYNLWYRNSDIIVQNKTKITNVVEIPKQKHFSIIECVANVFAVNTIFDCINITLVRYDTVYIKYL